MRCLAFVIAALVAPASGLDNGLGRTPVRGWNSWNHYGCSISEQLIHNQSAAFAKYLAPAGYEYMNLDDCWMSYNRTAAGKQIGDPVKFPSGMAALAKHVHGQGLKFGLYSARCKQTCQKRAASWGHQTIDAQQYADWGVDYLKLDNCGDCPNENYANALASYQLMGQALNKTGRPIFYMSELGTEYGMLPGGHAGPHTGPGVDTAVAPKLFNTDRVGNDINAHWKSVIGLVDDDEPHAPNARPGFFNDMDMLEVGNGMSLAEDESHMAMWCVLAAPLIVGCDMTTMSPDTLRILTSRGALAVDQDALGVQGTVCWQSDAHKALQVWRKPLSDGTVAVVALNRGMPAGTNLTIDLAKCGHAEADGEPATATAVTDVWTGRSLGSVTGPSYTTAGLPTHGHAFLRLSKQAAAGPAAHARCMRSNSKMERMALACPAGLRIVSVAAWWGNAPPASAACSDEAQWRAAAAAGAAAVDRTARVSGECLGRQSCSFEASERAVGQAAPGVADPRLATRFGCA